MAELKVDGLSDVLAAMAAFTPAVQKTILNGAVRKGANVVAKEAKARAPVKTGNLQKRIAVRKRKRGVPGAAAIYAVGVLGGASATYKNTRENRRKQRVGNAYQKQDTAFYWRFIEFGTQKMAAAPFLRPAFDSKATEAINTIADTLRTNLDKAVKKATGK